MSVVVSVEGVTLVVDGVERGFFSPFPIVQRAVQPKSEKIFRSLSRKIGIQKSVTRIFNHGSTGALALASPITVSSPALTIVETTPSSSPTPASVVALAALV